jgi:hypothetical protein
MPVYVKILLVCIFCITLAIGVVFIVKLLFG